MEKQSIIIYMILRESIFKGKNSDTPIRVRNAQIIDLLSCLYVRYLRFQQIQFVYSLGTRCH